jgi:hypothetical protein
MHVTGVGKKINGGPKKEKSLNFYPISAISVLV